MQALAQEVACYLGLDLSSIKIKRFADGEIYVQVQARLCRLPMSSQCLRLQSRPVPVLCRGLSSRSWQLNGGQVAAGLQPTT